MDCYNYSGERSYIKMFVYRVFQIFEYFGSGTFVYIYIYERPSLYSIFRHEQPDCPPQLDRNMGTKFVLQKALLRQ